jgi:hypothetical protein
MSVCAGMGDPRTWVICNQETDPERYCLNTDDPVFCKTIGDICDVDSFVKPEYPYDTLILSNVFNVRCDLCL